MEIHAMKKTLLALAVSMAALSSGAHAAWDNGVTSDLVTGNGELILSVWDAVTQNSYTQDLGITYEQIKSGAGFGTIALNSSALSVFSSTANLSSLQWSVLAASNAQYSGANFDAALTKAGFITTIAPGQGQLDISNGIALQQMGNVWGSATLYSDDLGFGSTNPAQNPVKTVTAGGVGYANGDNWENFLELSLGKDLSGGNGETSSLWLQTFVDNDGTQNLQKLLGNVTLNISSTSAGSLTIAPAVPVPAAFWLMGSALAGLGSIARKRRQAA